MALDWLNYGGASLWGPDRSGQINAYQSDAAEKEARRQREQREATALYDARDEARTRSQFEDDREYELRAKKLKQEREKIAITKGQAKADEWYNRQSVKLAKQKLQEDARQFNERLAFDRQQFQDTSLQGWTDKALQLSRSPRDWVTLERMQKGVASEAGNIPGLAWAAGGQLGNTTFAGQPESNSLANLLGNMGVNVGQGGGTAQPAASGSWASSAAEQANRIATMPLNLRPDQQQLYTTAREFAMNPQGAAPGWYEGLDPMTRDLLQGAAEDQGLDWASVQSRLKRSRWGGSGSSMAA